MSSLETSAIRRLRSDLLAAVTALAAASSHDFVLVPITSVTRYTPSPAFFFAMTSPPRQGSPPPQLPHSAGGLDHDTRDVDAHSPIVMGHSRERGSHDALWRTLFQALEGTR